MNRRDFLVNSALLGAGVGVLGAPSVLDALTTTILSKEDFRALAARALEAATSAGAEYADVRISRNNSQFVATRERRVTGLADNETFGFGVRVLAGGSWGFAASWNLSPDEIVRVARQAVAQARANARARIRPVELAPTEVHRDATWRSPIEIDPFDVPIEDKVALLLEANEVAMGIKGVRFVNSMMMFLREEKFFASTIGTVTEQTIYRALGISGAEWLAIPRAII